MGLWGQAVGVPESEQAGQGRRSRRRVDRRPRSAWRWFISEPRNAVLFALFAVVAIGGGRKVLHGLRARGAVGRLGEPGVSDEEIESTAAYGRSGLMELFRLLGTAETEATRRAAGHALSVIWAQDNLIPEEEQGLVRRGYDVSWRARRRYPRALRSPIPVAVSYGVPFLHESGEGIKPENLEWSHRIEGARRASLEEYSPWKAGPGRAEFPLIPGDFEGNGPHRLVLQSRVRTAGLTDFWQIDLHHVPFSFEFDPHLSVDALLALADADRADAIARSVRLGPAEEDAASETAFLILNDAFALRRPPALRVTTPLPCDLAHAVHVELEGIPGRYAAGELILSGQGESRGASDSVRRIAIGPAALLPVDAIDRPGLRRMRAVLTADPDRGWADPDVRSIWPGTVETDSVEVEVVRR